MRNISGCRLGKKRGFFIFGVVGGNNGLSGRMQKKQGRINFHGVWVIAIILASVAYHAVMVSPLVYGGFNSKVEKLKDDANYEGLELYFSGSGFLEDYKMMKTDYDRCYNAEESGSLASYEQLKGCEVKGIDCEDFSLLTARLAKEYEYPCEFYYEMRKYASLEGPQEHLGVVCNLEGRWVELN